GILACSRGWSAGRAEIQELFSPRRFREPRVFCRSFGRNSARCNSRSFYADGTRYLRRALYRPQDSLTCHASVFCLGNDDKRDDAEGNRGERVQKRNELNDEGCERDKHFHGGFLSGEVIDPENGKPDTEDDGGEYRNEPGGSDIERLAEGGDDIHEKREILKKIESEGRADEENRSNCRDPLLSLPVSTLPRSRIEGRRHTLGASRT